jgi:cysteine synthase
LFAGAGTAGALAAAAAVLPLQREAAPVVAAKPAPAAGGGYQLTAHVQRYYQTAKV